MWEALSIPCSDRIIGIGMEGLRVVDASVVPLPFASHYQATVHALTML